MNSPTTVQPVLMFSGQGSQKPKMGLDLLTDPLVLETFACSSDIFGYDMVKCIKESSQEQLNETQIAQAALSTLSIAIARSLLAAGLETKSLIGFSLGQISALHFAGFLNIEDTFKVIKVRASAMSRAAKENPGAMYVLLGAEEKEVLEACKQCAEGDVLAPANYNCPGQIVVSGTNSAINRIETYWKAHKKRGMRVATSGAFHSPLMESAAQELACYLEGVVFSHPHTSLISNVDAQVLTLDSVKDQLKNHLTHPVLFDKSIMILRDQGKRSFVEVGYGSVLTGLIKRIDKELVRNSVSNQEDYETVRKLYV